MFIVSWIGRLLGAPVGWLGQLCGWIRPSLAAGLYTIAWRLGRDGETAAMALATHARCRGEPAAIALAEQWMVSRPAPAIAACGGLLALQAGRIDLARRMVEAGKVLGTDRDGRLELLEWLVTTVSGDGRAVQALARRLEARRDLAPQMSQQVLITLLWEAVQAQRFDEARRRAEHLLSIDNVPQAEMALWALARRDGDAARAEGHLRRATLDPRHKLSYQVLGSIAIGDRLLAGECAAQLQRIDPPRGQALQALVTQEGSGR